MYIFYLYVQTVTRQCFCFPNNQWGVTTHDIKSTDGKFVLYFLAFNNSLGLLLMPGMSVALNINMANHTLFRFLVIICFTV